MGSVSISIREYSGEASTVSFNLGAVSAATGDIALDAAKTALQAAVDAMTVGVLARVTLTRQSEILSNAVPTVQTAQRQNKILVRFQDATTFELGSLEIPVADIAAVTIFPNTNEVDITQAPMSALVTAIETHAKSKAGNAVEVINALWVGRNL